MDWEEERGGGEMKRHIEELSDEEVKFVLENSYCWSDEDYWMPRRVLRNVFQRKTELGDIIEKSAEGKPSIELGPGQEPTLICNPSEYSGVEPFCPHSTKGAIENLVLGKFHIVGYRWTWEQIKEQLHQGKLNVAEIDAYSFLKNQPDNSSFIYSFGIWDLIGAGFDWWDRNKENWKKREIIFKYEKALAEHIFRITPGGNVTIHYEAGGSSEHYLKEAGFQKTEYLGVYLKPEKNKRKNK